MDITSIRYINMSKNWHRNLFMRLLLRTVPYKVIRCPGVEFNGESVLKEKYLKNGLHPYLSTEPVDRSKGVIGCWIAHSQALERVKERKGITVILEDDFVCKRGFFEHALNMVNSFDKDFDVILFDTWGLGPLKMHRIARNIYNTQRNGYPYYGGTHCLFVNNDRITKILEAKANNQVMDYDGFLLCNDKLNIYLFYTEACAARAVGSDIDTKHKLRYDFNGILTCLLPYARRERSRLFRSYFRVLKEMNVILSEKELSAFEGYYDQGQEDIHIRILIKEGRLGLFPSWNPEEVFFQPVSDVEFLAEGWPIPLKFIKDQNGEVTSLLLSNHISCQKNTSLESTLNC